MTLDLRGLVDAATPLDPAARRVLVAREMKRLGPTPGSAADRREPNWAETVLARFASLENERAQEIVECVLDPSYSPHARPDAVDVHRPLLRAQALEGSELQDRLHEDRHCGEIMVHVAVSGDRRSIWDQTAEARACHACVADPVVLWADAIRGIERRRVDIRTSVLTVVEQLQSGRVSWTSLERLGHLGAERWEQREIDGFIDTGNPELWPIDPIAEATIELATAVAHATGQHLGALWDAAMIEVLTRNVRTVRSPKTRRSFAVALGYALQGHSWAELANRVTDRTDGALTRRSSVHKKVAATLDPLESEIGEIVAEELDRWERNIEGHAGDLRPWRWDLARPDATADAELQSRIVMAYFGQPVPDVVERVIQLFPSLGAQSTGRSIRSKSARAKTGPSNQRPASARNGWTFR